MPVYTVGPRHVAVTGQIPSGFGPLIWVGELRTRRDRLVIGYARGGCMEVSEYPATGGHTCYPVSVGATEEQVLAAVSARAQRVVEAGR